VIPLTFISEFLRYALLVANKEKETSQILSVGILFSVALNLWLTPIYGLMAAATIAVFAEAILVLLYIKQLSDHLAVDHSGQVLYKPSIATVILVITLLIFKSFGLVAQYIFGVSSYLLAIWLLRVVESDELELITGFVLRRIGKISNEY
jgi:O-antigen/teichoic acid export membrane protein